MLIQGGMLITYTRVSSKWNSLSQRSEQKIKENQEAGWCCQFAPPNFDMCMEKSVAESTCLKMCESQGTLMTATFAVLTQGSWLLLWKAQVQDPLLFWM